MLRKYLKACPFCGSHDIEVKSTLKKREYRKSSIFTVTVHCNKCAAKGSDTTVECDYTSGCYDAIVKAFEEVAQRWNERVVQ